MGTPIDFGKDFLQALYRERDLEKTLGFLADDIVWVTPDEILHLKSGKEIRDYLAASISEDPQPYHVDVASIKSAAVAGNTNTIAYDVNLIPRREQDALNIRVSLTVHKTGKEYELIYVGMSRRYERSESEQLKDFMENLPSGVMVLAGFGGSVFRELYANSYFPVRLGYDADEFYDRSDNNPFFMIPDKEQRRMITLVNEMSTLKRPKPISVQINLVTQSGEKLPFQVTTRAAYKDKDGTRTVLYLLFSDLTEILLEQKRRKKRLAAREAEQKKASASGPVEATQQTEQLRREAEEMQERAADQLDNIDRLMQAAKEACDHAEEDARARADAEIAKANRAAEERIRALRADAETQKEQLRKEAEEQKTAAEQAAAEKVRSSEEALEKLREEKKTSDETYESRIRDLEQQVTQAREEGRTRLSQAQEDHQQEMEQVRSSLQEELDAARKSAAQEKEQQAAEIENLRADAEGSRQGFLTQIRRYQEKLAQNELGQKKQDVDAAIAEKEKEKSMERLSSLLDGQMNAIQSLAAAGEKEEDAAHRAAIGEKISSLAGAVPRMAEDLYAVARINPAERTPREDVFTLSDCLNTVIRVIRPKCRRKGIIFSCTTDGKVPDQVRGSKAGLQLAFLCILENAVTNTAQGGTIRLTAQADRPVRGSCYFHFTISDTGTGIPDDRLPVLFDNPTGELSIARRTIAAMGGSIQVRSSYGSGSRFEISVSLKLASPVSHAGH